MSNMTSETREVAGLLTLDSYIIFMEFHAITWAWMGLFGVISNFINIVVFVSMGLADGVIVSFLFLSISDFCYLLVSFTLSFAMGFALLEMRYHHVFAIDPHAVFVFLANTAHMIYTSTELTTSFLALVRCLCIARPLQFKNMFTKRVAVYCVTSFAVFAVVSYSPILGFMGLIPQYNDNLNLTRPTVWISPKRDRVKDICWTIVDVILPVIHQFVVIICVMVMISSLRKAAEFRQSSTLAAIPDSKTEISTISMDNSETKGVADIDVESKLTGKDLQVFQQVVLICSVFVVCNTPKIFLAVTGLLEQEFELGQRYHYLYLTLNCFRTLFEIFNSSVTILIYYRYNTRYRNACRSYIDLCCRRSKAK